LNLNLNPSIRAQGFKLNLNLNPSIRAQGF